MASPPIIIYEKGGIPIESAGEREWRRAIARGDIVADTPVTLLRAAGAGPLVSAADVPELRDILEQFDAFLTGRPMAVAEPVEARGPAEMGLRGRMRKAVDDYAGLMATRGARRRLFSELLAMFPEVHALRFDGEHDLRRAFYHEDDPNILVVAAGEGSDFVALPTYEYLSAFPIAFSSPVQNPLLVRQLFDFAADDSGQLQMVSPAFVTIDEAGAARLMKRGLLAGFRR